MIFKQKVLKSQLKDQLKESVYDVIGCLFTYAEIEKYYYDQDDGTITPF